jgi:hypothetical protein
VNRRKLITRIEGAFHEFQESFVGLSDPEMMKPGVTGDWSVRDILAHVTTWEQEALKHLPTILKGERPPRYSVAYGGINAFNRIMSEQKRDLTLTDVREDLEETHRQLLELVESVPEEHFLTETRFRQRLRLDTYRHYPKHAQAIRKWRIEQQFNGKEKS